MQEMVEPDRTILIVSIVGLVVIWGSVAYHKFVQDGAPVGGTTSPDVAVATSAASAVAAAPNAQAVPAPAAQRKRKRKGKR